LKDAMPAMVNTPELRFQSSEDRKFVVVEDVLARLRAAGARVDETDGARVTTADGWWLLRASNTQDVLVARVEARSAEALLRLQHDLDSQLALSGVAPTAGDH
jgi:phosphomannomutase